MYLRLLWHQRVRQIRIDSLHEGKKVFSLFSHSYSTLLTPDVWDFPTHIKQFCCGHHLGVL